MSSPVEVAREGVVYLVWRCLGMGNVRRRQTWSFLVVCFPVIAVVVEEVGDVAKDLECDGVV